jgi:hypothetical protein
MESAMTQARELLAQTISLGNDTDVSEWDDCLLMADLIIAAGWSIAPKITMADALQEALEDMQARKIVGARQTIERVIKELRTSENCRSAALASRPTTPEEVADKAAWLIEDAWTGPHWIHRDFDARAWAKHFRKCADADHEGLRHPKCPALCAKDANDAMGFPSKAEAEAWLSAQPKWMRNCQWRPIEHSWPEVSTTEAQLAETMPRDVHQLDEWIAEAHQEGYAEGQGDAAQRVLSDDVAMAR